MITEQEFHALAAQGHNRIPLVAQALARMDDEPPAPTLTAQTHDLIRHPQEYGELFALAAAASQQDLFA